MGTIIYTAIDLHTHLHRYGSVWLITLNNNILWLEVIDVFYLSAPTNLGEWPGLALELNLECVDVIFVHVRVSQLDNELVCGRVCEVRDDMR